MHAPYGSELQRLARLLYRRGYTVLPSRHKIPACRWKYADADRSAIVTREQLYACTQHRSDYDSLTLRLDDGVAVLDCDFYLPQLTQAWVDLLAHDGRRLYGVQGSKGVKLVFALPGKSGVAPTLRLGEAVCPPGRADQICMLEVKQDVAAVCGRHSPQHVYHPLPPLAFIDELPPPGYLPRWTLPQLLARWKLITSQLGLVGVSSR